MAPSDKNGDQDADRNDPASDPSAAELLRQARRHFEEMDWHGALDLANRAVAAEPTSDEARRLRDTAREKVQELESELQRKKAVAAARRDVSGRLEAGEIQGAAEHLRRAIEAYGRVPALEALEEELHQARALADVKAKDEWAERRSREARELIDESARLATRLDYDGALEKLRQAQRIDPEHEQIDELIATAESQARSYAEEEAKDRQIEVAIQGVRRLLDGFHLEGAETRLHMARKRFGDDPRLDPLERRLAELRRSARSDVALPTPQNLNKISQLEPLIRQRQRSLAEAYSWTAALLYPLRRPALFLSLAAVLFAVGLLVHNFRLHPLLGVVGPLFGLVLLPAIVRHTLEGQNDPPTPYQLGKHARFAADAALILGAFLVFCLPILLFVLTRPWHPLLEADSGPVGWMLLAVLLWGACALLVPAWGVGAAFGPSFATRLDRLFSCLGISGRAILTVNAVFFYVVLGLVLRALLLEVVPWVALPALALFEAYGLVLLPHLLGVMVRDRRLEWAKVHAG